MNIEDIPLRRYKDFDYITSEMSNTMSIRKHNKLAQAYLDIDNCGWGALKSAGHAVAAIVDADGLEFDAEGDEPNALKENTFPRWFPAPKPVIRSNADMVWFWD